MRALLILLFISNTLFSQTFEIPNLIGLVTVYDENTDEYYINYKTKELKLKFRDIEIEGSLALWQLRNGRKYIVVNGKNNIHMLMRFLDEETFYGIDILEGEFDDVWKGIKKLRKYDKKKVKILYSSLPSQSYDKQDFNLITERKYKLNKDLEEIEAKYNKEREEIEARRKERELKEAALKAEKEEKFKKDLAESGFEGIYKLKILSSEGSSISGDVEGKMTITRVGITIETEVDDMELFRGVYDMVYANRPKEGKFTCRTVKGSFGNRFVVVIDKDGGGAFTAQEGSDLYLTTTFSFTNFY